MLFLGRLGMRARQLAVRDCQTAEEVFLVEDEAVPVRVTCSRKHRGDEG